MGLSAREFWTLTFREFGIKHRAFMRAEDRHKSLAYMLASLIGQYAEKDVRKLQQNENLLRRYPIKPWLSQL